MKKETSNPSSDILSRPEFTDEAREMRMASLAYDLAEQKLRDGTASSQLITQCMKFASSRERLEKEILARQGELLTAKTESIQSAKQSEELFQQAMDALKDYRSSDEQ